MFDEIDLQILSIVQNSAKTNNAEIARQVGMAPSAVLERVRKLESRGVIEGYRALLSADALGLGLLAFVFVKTNEVLGDPSAGDQLAAVPEVQEVHHVAGEDCYLIKVRAANPEALGRLLRQTLGKIPSVVSTRSTIVLHTVKEHGGLPLGAPEKPGETSS
jgi:Lrp/AsnC family transcriptional regulator, leucine-responsive regulatory protein